MNIQGINEQKLEKDQKQRCIFEKGKAFAIQSGDAINMALMNN